jgi:hypothetical protein
MTRHAPELDLLAAARPQACGQTAVLVSDDERRVLLAAITADERQPRAGRRPRRGLIALTVAVTAAALAAGAVLLASARPGTAPDGSRRILTTAYVVGATETALASTSRDVLEMHWADRAGVASTVWLDVPTGAFRTDAYSYGALASVTYVEHGTGVIVYYPGRQWLSFTRRSHASVLASVLTPQHIHAQLEAGQYRLAGEATVDGQHCLELRAVLGPVGKRLPPAAVIRLRRTVDLWVNARTFLPVLEIITGPGPISSQISFSWEPVTPASTAVFRVHIPAGFKNISGP